MTRKQIRAELRRLGRLMASHYRAYQLGRRDGAVS